VPHLYFPLLLVNPGLNLGEEEKAVKGLLLFHVQELSAGNPYEDQEVQQSVGHENSPLPASRKGVNHPVLGNLMPSPGRDSTEAPVLRLLERDNDLLPNEDHSLRRSASSEVSFGHGFSALGTFSLFVWNIIGDGRWNPITSAVCRISNVFSLGLGGLSISWP
jgi:hypothetical protein